MGRGGPRRSSRRDDGSVGPALLRERRFDAGATVRVPLRGRPPRGAGGVQAAGTTGDEEAIGAAGYPPCCREFFRRVWVDDAMVDTTWPMAAAGNGQTARGASTWRAAQANILWRWMGARAVPHLPAASTAPPRCSSPTNCSRSAGSRASTRRWTGWSRSCRGRQSGPRCTASPRSRRRCSRSSPAPTPRRATWCAPGGRYPAEGAARPSFPFGPVKLRISESRGFQQGLEHAVHHRHRAGSPPTTGLRRGGDGHAHRRSSRRRQPPSPGTGGP